MGDAQVISDIAAVIYRYSRAMDAREWQLMDDVFTPDAVGDLGGLICNGRIETVRFIRTAIECCERTHHMNSNLEVVVARDSAQASSRFSAWHTGKDRTKHTIFQALGTYTDEFVRTAAGWRIKRRTECTQMEVWLDASHPGSMAEFFAAAFASTDARSV